MLYGNAAGDEFVCTCFLIIAFDVEKNGGHWCIFDLYICILEFSSHFFKHLKQTQTWYMCRLFNDAPAILVKTQIWELRVSNSPGFGL